MKRVCSRLESKVIKINFNKKSPRKRKRISMNFAKIHKHALFSLKIDLFVLKKNKLNQKICFFLLKQVKRKTPNRKIQLEKKLFRSSNSRKNKKNGCTKKIKQDLKRLLKNVNSNPLKSKEPTKVIKPKIQSTKKVRNLSSKKIKAPKRSLSRKRKKKRKNHLELDLPVIKEAEVESDSLDDLKLAKKTSFENRLWKSSNPQNTIYMSPVGRTKNLISIDSLSESRESNLQDNLIDFSFISEANISDLSYEKSIEDDLISKRAISRKMKSSKKKPNFEFLKQINSPSKTFRRLNFSLSPEKKRKISFDKMIGIKKYETFRENRRVIDMIINTNEEQAHFGRIREVKEVKIRHVEALEKVLKIVEEKEKTEQQHNIVCSFKTLKRFFG